MAEILMRFDAAQRALGGRFLDFRRASEAGFSSVHIDSREIAAGGLFVALAGSVQDGSRFAAAAFKAGAVAALVAESALDDPTLDLAEGARNAGAVLFAVPDTLRGLQDLAAAYLSQFPRLIRVGVTGSSGKTTTREIAAAIAGREKSVATSPGNLNSETGLPLAVFTVRPHHEVGIFEMGMNRRGEIRELARVLKPAIALITNIGSAHIGILGSKTAILEEKKAVFSEFTGTELALIPAEESRREELAEGVAGRVVFYGAASCPELGEVRDLGLEGTELIWEGEKVRFGLTGKHNVKNALAAIAIARAIPVSSAAIREGLASVKPLFGRGEILRGAVTVIRDCYNANPESAAAAIAFCDDLEWPGRKVYVIGSMLELGEESGAAHRSIGSLLAASRADRIFLYGAETEAALAALEGVPGVFHTNAMDALAEELKGYVCSGDLVLLKGSRGCALERLGGVLTEAA
ncbi:MAG: UDP-N-acetylmuramoyl-tripeptide--D-alanyl-D-alanine ligase [Treponema sp.]|jgi:UDP-N-acetylmuramoyl-tripeptide--D-alanyl-D-alanine ligase|nr:UDP-N-acetylmuramoyl-tripeptide--D-alanyl-D-alanine ligase [Treponema sp.]